MVTVANFAIFILGVIKGADLTSLGTGLALVNTPLYAYIWGDSYRPSNNPCDETDLGKKDIPR
jgi:hypothetical protein